MISTGSSLGFSLEEVQGNPAQPCFGAAGAPCHGNPFLPGHLQPSHLPAPGPAFLRQPLSFRCCPSQIHPLGADPSLPMKACLHPKKKNAENAEQPLRSEAFCIDCVEEHKLSRQRAVPGAACLNVLCHDEPSKPMPRYRSCCSAAPAGTAGEAAPGRGG